MTVPPLAKPYWAVICCTSECTADYQIVQSHCRPVPPRGCTVMGPTPRPPTSAQLEEMARACLEALPPPAAPPATEEPIPGVPPGAPSPAPVRVSWSVWEREDGTCYVRVSTAPPESPSDTRLASYPDRVQAEQRAADCALPCDRRTLCDPLSMSLESLWAWSTGMGAKNWKRRMRQYVWPEVARLMALPSAAEIQAEVDQRLQDAILTDYGSLSQPAGLEVFP